MMDQLCGRWNREKQFGTALAIVTLVLGAITSASGQSIVRTPSDNAQTLRITKSREAGLATFVTTDSGEPIPVRPAAPGVVVQPMDFFEQHGSLFGVLDAQRELLLLRQEVGTLGQTHTTYQQVYRGVSVFSGILKVHQNARGEVVAANGHFRPLRAKIDIRPKLSTDSAVAIARRLLSEAPLVVEHSELVIVDPGWYGDPPAGVHLAYYLILSDVAASVREAFFIDAHTGSVLDQWSTMHTVLNRTIYDGGGESELPGVRVRLEGGDPVAEPEDANRAYDYLGDTYDYFFRAFGRDSFDGMGAAMITTVRSTVAGCPNAIWSGHRLQAALCEGVVTDDVIAHELMHGVMQFTADLIYQNQSGQLNEAYSDIFGELVDLFNGDAAFIDGIDGAAWPEHATGPGLDTPNLPRSTCSTVENGYADGVRWLIGEDITARPGAIRDMWDPPCMGDPDRANSDLQQCRSIDSGGVHSGSGIVNHAFAMVTDGKTFNRQEVHGIGPIKSGAVWYRALTTYLTIASDFEDAYQALNQAALDLIGTFPNDPRTGMPSDDIFTAFDAEQVDLSLQAVEMNTPGRCGESVDVLRGDPAPICANRITFFFDNFEDDVEDDPLGWSVSNVGPHGPPTPYDWVRTRTPLPFDRPGRARFCADPSIGDCDEQDESAVHSLISPAIEIPRDALFPMLSFAHYVATEPGWDGGTLGIRIGDGDWQPIQSSAFLHNPFSSIIRSSSLGNTNPIAGAEGWTGIAGGWGTSVVDLSELVTGGDVVRFRFDFGKDGCGGLDGWYVDDVELFVCEDCNRNGIPDGRDKRFTRSSDPLANIGDGVDQRFVIAQTPPAVGDVTLTFLASADLEFDHESLTVDINGTVVGTVFDVGAQDCPLTPNADRIVIPPDMFNELTAESEAIIRIIATETVNPVLCGGASFVKVFVEYDPLLADEDDNGVPDECEGCRPSIAPAPLSNGWPANRYLSLRPNNTGRLTALRVEIPSAASGGSVAEANQTRWVGAPNPLNGLQDGGGVAVAAPLSCDPVYLDWSAFDEVHVYGDAIIPNRTFHIEAHDLACAVAGEMTGATEIATFATARWGDVVGGAGLDPPNGEVDFQDIAAAVDAFSGAVTLQRIVRADVFPATPNQIVDFSDIAAIVDAFSGGDYPFTPEQDCP